MPTECELTRWMCRTAGPCLALAFLLGASLPGFAQEPLPVETTPAPTATQPPQPLDSAQRDVTLDPVVILTKRQSEVSIMEQQAKVIELKDAMRRVYGFDPNVITVKALDRHRIHVQALVQGVTTLVITDEFNRNYSVEVFVQGDTRHLQAIINNRFPNSSIEAYKVQDAVALTGWVSNPDHIMQVVDIAETLYPKVLNQMDVGGVQQVKIKVKIMEVQRSKLRRMGFNFLAVGSDGFISSTPGQLTQLGSVTLSPGGTSVSFTEATLGAASTAVGFVTDNLAVQSFFDALKEEELLKVLAEPVLVTTNGRPAMMLSGGEFPVLVPQSLGTVSIEWRDFGVRIEAVPRVLGDGRVRLEVMPEVSERDFANSVTLTGTTIPALTTRRVNTQVEMRFGQTLMLAGLISSRQTSQTQKIPFLGELPWAGTFFRRVRFDDVETELVILLTPEMVAPLEANQLPYGGPGPFTTAPTDRELYWDGFLEVPKYGDDCANCLGLGGAGPCTTCQPTMQFNAPQTRPFAMPIQEEIVPVADPRNQPADPARRAADPARSVDPTRATAPVLPDNITPETAALLRARQDMALRARQARRTAPAAAVRQTPPTRPIRQVQFIEPPTRPGTAIPRTVGTSRLNQSAPGTAAGRSNSRLPGLIEP